MTALTRPILTCAFLFLIVLSLARTAIAQPGSGMKTGTAMGTNSATGATDILGAGALNMQFDMMAMLLQQRTLLFASILSDPGMRQALIEEQRRAAARLKEYEVRGRSIIQQHRATTMFTPVADPTRPERIASAFGADAAKRGLVPTNLRVYESLAREFGLQPYDMADVMAATVTICYQVYRDLSNWRISDKALADLRTVTRKAVLADARYQGMPNHNKHMLRDYIVVWVMSLVADYRDAHGLTYLSLPLEQVRERAGAALQVLMGVAADRLQFSEQGFAIK